MLDCERLDYARVPWGELDAFPDRTVFQTRGWLEYLRESQGALPVVLALTRQSVPVGYFTGAVVKKWGVSILGSPFPGWNTPYIGFNLKPGVSRVEALDAVERFAFRGLGCRHMEIADPEFSSADGVCLDFEQKYYRSYATCLTHTEDELFAAMEGACRRCIRKAEREGVVMEHATDLEFGGEYLTQLQDVFAKQGLTPTYGAERVGPLLKHMIPTGNLLLLRARNQAGECIATGLYPGFNRRAFFWGNASWREHQNLRPNEAMHWYAMRYWKARGATVFDWGGRSAGGASVYKEKYGVTHLDVPWFTMSNPKALGAVRDALRAVYYGRRKYLARFRAKPAAPR